MTCAIVENSKMIEVLAAGRELSSAMQVLLTQVLASHVAGHRRGNGVHYVWELALACCPSLAGIPSGQLSRSRDAKVANLLRWLCLAPSRSLSLSLSLSLCVSSSLLSSFPECLAEEFPSKGEGAFGSRADQNL